MRTYSVPERIKFRQMQATNNDSWHLGKVVMQAWVRRYGNLPDKDLRTKTHGGGSHMFAIYPKHFVPTIDAIIDRFDLSRSRQGDLFAQEGDQEHQGS